MANLNNIAQRALENLVPPSSRQCAFDSPAPLQLNSQEQGSNPDPGTSPARSTEKHTIGTTIAEPHIPTPASEPPVPAHIPTPAPDEDDSTHESCPTENFLPSEYDDLRSAMEGEDGDIVSPLLVTLDRLVKFLEVRASYAVLFITLHARSG